MPIHSLLPLSRSNSTSRRSSRPLRWASVIGKITVPEMRAFAVAIDRNRAVLCVRLVLCPAWLRWQRVARADRLIWRPAEMIPSRKAIVEICPSPTARSDSRMRTLPGCKPDLIGMAHDAGVHQRGGGIAVFMAEIGTDQPLGLPPERAAIKLQAPLRSGM